MTLRRRLLVAGSTLMTRVAGLRLEVRPDRRHRLKAMGARPRIGRRVEFVFPENISIGDDVTLNNDAHLAGEGGIIIGDQVLIGPRVMFFSFNHVFADQSTPYRDQGLEMAPIVVGDNVWIGAGAIILAGVTVGDGAVVGAGTVVHSNVPAGAVVVGCAQRIVRTGPRNGSRVE